MKEIWKGIEGFEKYFMVSNLGRVKRMARIVQFNGFKKMLKESIMNQYGNGRGYLQINLQLNGKYNFKKVHRLVAMAFIPNPHNKPQVNHLNGCKTDNVVSNLEWATNSENQIHAHSTGLVDSSKKGRSGALNKNNIPVLQLSVDGAILDTFYSITIASKKTGTWRGGITKACDGIYETSGGFKWRYKNTKN